MPGVNETHYLGKARHWWSPEWCQNDLLIGSCDAHVVFFWLVGWLPDTVGLTGTAILGRTLGLLVLAAGWTAFGLRVTGAGRAVWLGVLCYLGLYQLGTLSGEWLVGGIEGKIPAWGCCLFALRFAIDRRWIGFGLNAGIATALHPVVGAWLVLSLAGCELVRTLRSDPPWHEGSAKSLTVGILVACALSLPGLIPATTVLRGPTDIPAGLEKEVRDVAEIQPKADYIQVYGRLKHHLDPMDFDWSGWVRYALLLVVWLAFARKRTDMMRLHLIVLTAALFAIAALAVGFGPRPAMNMVGYAWRAKLLKLYPFRFIDGLLPIVVGLQVGRLLIARFNQRQVVLGSIVALGLLLVPSALIAARTSSKRQVDWLDSCRWIRANTDMETICVTPRESLNFKWFAERPEFVNYKDCPQDAVGILEWNRRLWLLQGWRQRSLADDDAYSHQDLANFRQLTGASYLVTRRIEPILVEPTYRNETYRIYKLPEPE